MMRVRPQPLLLLAAVATLLVALAGGCGARNLGAENDNHSNQNENLNENQNQNQNTPIPQPTLDILLTVYGPSGEVVETRTVHDMGPVTIAPPYDEPDDPPEWPYVVMAQAEGYYTELFSCDHGGSIDVQLDAVPALEGAMTGVIIRTSYFEQPSYFAQGTVRLVPPGTTASTETLSTDDQGRYLLADAEAGTWGFEVVCNEWEYPVPYSFDVPNSAGTDYLDLFFETDMSIDAPNLYLYPEETTRVSVTLGFPQGGEVTLSDPPYEGGWDVTAAPDGTIDGAFPYLFYEARLPHHVQRDEGWVLAAGDLEAGLARLLAEHGFAGREITDFLDYWLPLMTDASWYALYPMEADPLVTLSISPAPDRIRRLWLFMEPLAAPISLPAPAAPPALQRDGFTAVEWGAFLGR